MSAWGSDLFQCDRDLGIVDALNIELKMKAIKAVAIRDPREHLAAGFKPEEIKLYRFGRNRDVSIHNPEVPMLVRDVFDTGGLDRLVGRHRGEEYELYIIIACAMELGCTLPSELHTWLLRHHYTSVLMPGARKQLLEAFDEYEDGVPYKFRYRGLDDTVPSDVLSYKEKFNYQSLEDLPEGETIPQIKIPPMKFDFNWPVTACGNCGRTACRGGGPLKRCAGCKKRFYCSLHCSLDHWTNHSEHCEGLLAEGKPDERGEDERCTAVDDEAENDDWQG